MKTQIRAKTLPLEQERAWKAADEHLWSQIRSLFDRCPELTGFSVQAKLSADFRWVVESVFPIVLTHAFGIA